MRRVAPSPLRDAWVMLPVALVLLLGVVAFTLLTYRNGVRLLVAERQQEALALANDTADRMTDGKAPTLAALRSLHPALERLVVADERGGVLEVVGLPLDGTFAAPLDGRLPDGPAAVGPGGRAGPSTVAFAPLLAPNSSRWLRVDLAAPVLAGQRRALGILTWTGLGAGTAVLVWLVLFLRQLLGPYEALLVRARELGGNAKEDDAALLLATLERALGAVPRDEGGAGEEPGGRERNEELAVLERTLATSLESGLLLLDREARVLALNPAGAALLGPPPPPRTPLAELLAAQPSLQALLAPAIAGGEGLQREECNVFVGGETRAIGLTMTPLRRAGGELLGYLVLFADLTASERELHQARLAESLAHLGELAAGVAHELRNGLATLGGYVSLLERNPSGPETGEYLAELRGETQRLERVVADFLGFTHPGAAHLVAVELGALVQHAAADPALDGGALRVEATRDERSAPPLLAGDPQLLERALRNLLRNAIEAQQRSGATTPVEVESGWREGGYEIAIRDRGPGVSPEMRKRLFQPFATDRPGGVGLGLALAHRIVALHGGTLALEPRADGGTTTRIAFPAELFGEAVQRL